MSIQQQVPAKEEIKVWLTQWIANDLDLPVDEIQTSKSLLDYSLSSITATMLVGDLEDWLGLTLVPTLVWDYPSIDALVDHLSQKLAETSAAGGDGAPSANGAAQHAASNQEAQELLSNLDGLSDQEVSELLDKLMANRSAPVGS